MTPHLIKLLVLVAFTTPLLAQRPNSEPWGNSTICHLSSTTSPQWIINAPIYYHWEDRYAYINFEMYNPASHTKSSCYTTNENRPTDSLSGTCVWLDDGYDPPREVRTGNFTWEGYMRLDRRTPRVLKLTQDPWCCCALDWMHKPPPLVGPDANYSGTATITLPPFNEAPWTCQSRGREGEVDCNYRAALTVTANITKL